MEATPPVIAKRLWKVVRIVFFMLRKGISKRKLMMDLHLMMKRGKIAGKAIGNLMFHHHSSFSCRSQDAHMSSFIAPRDYEFSCSNSPAFPFHVTKRGKNHHFPQTKHDHHHHRHPHHNYFSCMHPDAVDDDVATTLQKTLEMLNAEMPEASPFPGMSFGRSPMMVRQLRITDSPFPLKNADDDGHVDKEAEEFIEKFYAQLKQQQKMVATEAKLQDMLGRRA